MTTVLQHSPGQVATLFVQILDGYGNRADTIYPPVITRIILPNFTFACGYPVYMNRFDKGIYFSQFQIPSGGSSVGSYLVDVVYDDLTRGYFDVYPDGYCDGYHDGYFHNHCDGYYDGYYDGYCDGYHYGNRFVYAKTRELYQIVVTAPYGQYGVSAS